MDVCRLYEKSSACIYPRMKENAVSKYIGSYFLLILNLCHFSHFVPYIYAYGVLFRSNHDYAIHNNNEECLDSFYLIYTIKIGNDLNL